MKAWNIALVSENNKLISKKTAFSRFCWSLFGIGNLAMFFNKEKMALQDYMTKTKLIRTKN